MPVRYRMFYACVINKTAHIYKYAGPSDRAVLDRAPAAIMGSNPTGDMDVWCVCCQVEVSTTS
jgi:hypothetical protein